MLVALWNFLKAGWSRANDQIMRGAGRRPIPSFVSPEAVGAYAVARFKYQGDKFNGAGYFRHPDGSPWGADSIQGEPMDRDVTSAGTTGSTTPNTLIGQKLYLLPPHGALTVSKVEALIPFLIMAASSGSAIVDKVELVVVKISAAGVETTLGSPGVNSTSASAATYQTLYTRFVSADLGASYAVDATERLGIRIKWYGHHSTGSDNVNVYPLVDFDGQDLASPPASYATWHTRPVRFAFYVA
jgi:hypothetical protein